jgi:26S proteasome regulatory subunit T1
MGKDYLGKDMRKSNKDDQEKETKDFKSLDEKDIKLLKTYGQGPYSKAIKQVEATDTLRAWM